MNELFTTDCELDASLLVRDACNYEWLSFIMIVAIKWRNKTRFTGSRFSFRCTLVECIVSLRNNNIFVHKTLTSP